MIQPINALSPRAAFRGTRTTHLNPAGMSDPKIAALNAGGVAAAVGALTMAVSRSYTSSWSHAGVFGGGAALLTMFFLTPSLIQKMGLTKLAKNKHGDTYVKEDAQKMSEVVKEHLKPVKKMVQFRQQS